MKLTDVITLAKQGFTATDIKELLAVKDEPPVDPPKEEDPPKETDNEGAKPKPKEEQADPTVLEELASLKEQVKKMQEQKIKEPIEPPKKEEFNEDELLTNFFK